VQLENEVKHLENSLVFSSQRHKLGEDGELKGVTCFS